MEIRQANRNDLGRISEIMVFNNRINYLPIFNDEDFSFNVMRVDKLIPEYEKLIDNLYVLIDKDILRGFMEIDDERLVKLYVDPFFQRRGYGDKLINYAIDNFDIKYLWALEKNEKAIKFYQRHGFNVTNEKKFEEDTTEYLIKLLR
ncbi:MAG: GNAT family N-acetyltransferase [Erysipelotrichaceae bacterium]|nr:GNAT family N-acetyltransferase [Erysipelotrichaceae bacterium]